MFMYVPISRRWLCWNAVVAGVLAASSRRTFAGTGKEGDAAIVQPATTDAAAFIKRAFEMRRLAVENGDQAYGAVIVRHNVIIGQSWSRVVLDQDPTGHAEISAIRDAARRLNSRSLNGAILYSSSRPCPMCEAAAYWADIDGLVYGRNADNVGAPRLCR
jgi:tRNA(Arg) A34 adenosine deaminase TadA